MTPQTTFVGGINPWKASPEHRPRGVIAVVPDPEPVVKPARRAPHTSRRGAVLEQIKMLGMASRSALMESMGLPRHVIDCALDGLRKDGRVLVKNVPITNRKPSHLYYAP